MRSPRAGRPPGESFVVGPSSRPEAWADFFAASAWSAADLGRLIESEPPGSAFFQIETQINGLYRAREQALRMRQQLGLPVDPERLSEVEQKARWLAAAAEPYRRRLGPAGRELDLGLMRWMRRASCLSMVVGAGATVAAGGPTWAGLVRQLLTLVLERGRVRSEMKPTADSTPDQQAWRRVVTDVEHLAPEEADRARRCLADIAEGRASTDTLMQGAQLCYDFLGQHLFTDITGILYGSAQEPGPIHRAVAELAHPLEVRDRGGWFPGWASIISYNFDDLMGEALDAAGLARASFAMRGSEVAGDPNEQARRAGQDGLYQGVYHLHGYTPRKLFLITHVRFVFSTSQYAETYGGPAAGIIGEVFGRWLARPVQHALYVGCSFQDEAMNGLLRAAAAALPGRSHYAFLKWPGATPFAEATPEDVAEAGATYGAMGVRPIWVDGYEEIPELIRGLA